MTDDLFNSLFVADESATESTAKTSFPDYPEENPGKATKIKFIETWEDALRAAGFSAPWTQLLYTWR